MSDQQDPMREALREVSKWLNEQPNRPIDRQAVAVLCAALATPTASGDMVSVPRELIRSTLAHLEFIERNTVHDARDLRQRLSAANESVQAQPVAGDADAARYRYIVDNNIILSGGGWPIAPFGRKDCDRYIDARLAQAKGENNG